MLFYSILFYSILLCFQLALSCYFPVGFVGGFFQLGLWGFFSSWVCGVFFSWVCGGFFQLGLWVFSSSWVCGVLFSQLGLWGISQLGLCCFSQLSLSFGWVCVVAVFSVEFVGGFQPELCFFPHWVCAFFPQLPLFV